MLGRFTLLFVLAALPAPMVAQQLVRAIAPVPVVRPSGDVLRNPFGGGLWQPRIGLRDVDGDGHLDLFALNPDGELRYYRNEGDHRFSRIVGSAYDSLPVANWFRFADLNGDGAAEILTAGPRSEVMVLDNDGTDAAPAFRVPARALLDNLGDTIVMQRETVPAFADIDADGDLDLFAGNLDGSITFYRNTGTAGAPALTFETAKYEDILVVAPIRTRDRDDGGDLLRSSRHGASVLDFADLDGDGDLDIFFGDYFTRKLLHFDNAGTAREADYSMERLDTAFRPSGDDVESEGFNQPVLGDIDGDGDLDAIISSLYPSSDDAPLVLYENVGTRTDPAMRRRSIDLVSEIDLGKSAAPALIADALRNGILVGASDGRLTYFERIVGDPAGGYRIASTFALPGLYQTIPATGDLDADGIAEVVVGESDGAIIFHRFAGSALERYGDTLLLARNASPALVDLDRDGDLDIVAGAANGRITYFENRGSASAARFERATPPSPFDSLDVGFDSSPRFFDLDGDGVDEALIGARTGGASTRGDTIHIFERDGGAWIRSSRYPALAVARNPVPLALRLPAGLLLLVGDLAGGIKAYVESPQTGVGDDGAGNDALRFGFDGDVLVVRWPSDGSRSGAIRFMDVLGRTVGSVARVDGETVSRVAICVLPVGVVLVEGITERSRGAVVVRVGR